MCMTLHLSTLNNICESCDQLHKCLESVCNLSISFALDTTLKRFVSSVNFNTLEHTESSKSFIYIRNKSGPNTDPWGTPLITFVYLELLPIKTTLCSISLSQSSIQSYILLIIPNALTFIINLLCGILSKAFWKSRYITSIGYPRST